MIVCVSCKKEMKCLKNGVAVRYGDSHVYSGDKYGCPVCGVEVIHANDRPHHSTDELKEDDIQMPS